MKTKLKVTGAALIAVLAFSAVSAASAQSAPHWNVKGSPLVGSRITKTTTIATGDFRVTVPGLLRITCTALDVESGSIIAPKTSTASSLVWTGCTIQTSTGGVTNCQVKSSGGTVGTITTTAVNSELVEVGGVIYDRYSAASGTLLTTLVIEAQAGKTCALSGTTKLEGTVALKPETGTNAKVVNFEASETIAKAAGAKLLWGTRKVFLDALVGLSLATEETWGVAP